MLNDFESTTDPSLPVARVGSPGGLSWSLPTCSALPRTSSALVAGNEGSGRPEPRTGPTVERSEREKFEESVGL